MTRESTATVEHAVAQVAAGRPVVVLDDADRENEGDLIVAAEKIEATTMAFLVRHTSGFVCAALPIQECERLALPPLHHDNADRFGTAYRVTVDAVTGVTTGISARDRAHTVRLLASASARPVDFSRPGHVVPLAARPGGVLERAGHTEAAVDLARVAGLRPVGVLCEIVSAREPGRMARSDELVQFAADHGLALITIADLAAHRRATESRLERVVGTRLPTSAGRFRVAGYRNALDGGEHIAVVAGRPDGIDVPVHVHGECLLGDVFGSRRCGCARRLDAALCELERRGRGVVVYLRGTRSPLTALSALQGVDDAGVQRLGAGADTSCAWLDPDLVLEILADLGVASYGHLHNPQPVRAVLDAAARRAAATLGPADRAATATDRVGAPAEVA